eukprot:gb/GECG01007210.1/.p1 GENE.gb/GECG01007210.1/~~gb/GECG01007210.1/.p1  ORF type:complete len:834 (+),score=148.72 gb/GECG01007210.1/:1-2502(+)
MSKQIMERTSLETSSTAWEDSIERLERRLTDYKQGRRLPAACSPKQIATDLQAVLEQEADEDEVSTVRSSSEKEFHQLVSHLAAEDGNIITQIFRILEPLQIVLFNLQNIRHLQPLVYPLSEELHQIRQQTARGKHATADSRAKQISELRRFVGEDPSFQDARASLKEEDGLYSLPKGQLKDEQLLAASISDLSSNIGRLKDSLSQVAECVNKNSQVKNLKKRNKALEHHVNYMKQVLKEASEELKSLKEQKTSKDQQIEDLQNQVKELEYVPKTDKKEDSSNGDERQRTETTSGDDTSEGVKSTTITAHEDVEQLKQKYRGAMDTNNELRNRVDELDKEVAHLKENLRDRRGESILDDIAEELQFSGQVMATDAAEEDKLRSAIGQDQLQESLERVRHSLLDVQEFERVRECCLEHERNVPQNGWSSELSSGDPPQWSDHNEEIRKCKDEVRLPNKSWYWLDDWSIEKGVDVDDNGWAYGENFADLNNSVVKRDAPRRMKGSNDAVRRRKWTRTRVKIGLLSDSSKIGKKYGKSCSEEVQEVLTESCKVILGLAKRLQAQDRILKVVATELHTRRKTIEDYEKRTSSLLQKMADAEAFGDVKRLGVTSGTDVKVIRGGRSSRNLHALASSQDVLEAKPSSPASEGLLQKFKKRLTLSPSKKPSKETIETFLYAAQAGDVERWKQMLKKGEVKLEETDSQGRTAVLYAARGGQISSLEALHFEGADFSHVDSNGRNALHYATRQGCMDATVWLLSQGFSVHTTDGHALTPLHQAALGKHPLLCELLLGKGADTQATDVHGRTPLMVAERFTDDSDVANETIQVLRNAKAGTEL